MRVLLNDIEGALETETTKFYMAEIFSALFYLHDNFIIHRDVKPENVLLGESASGVHVKLCDFATAKDVQDAAGHRSSTFVGSAEYVSPELLGFDSANGRYTCFESDIWAAGCIMYFMLSGLPPFRAESDHATFRKVETVNYSFPDGFYASGKDLINAILIGPAKDRIGANGKHEEIKNHPFFDQIEWSDLHQQSPPEIRQYFQPSSSRKQSDQFYDDMLMAEINWTEGSNGPVDESPTSKVDDAQGLGIPLILKPTQYETLLNDQLDNEQNVARQWNRFVDNELILKLGFMDKKRGLFPRKRMFLLTGGKLSLNPRIVYVDATRTPAEKKGEIRLHKDIEIRQLTFSRFHIFDPHIGRNGRIYDLIDKNSNFGMNAGAQQWIQKLKKLKEIYFA